MSRNVRVVVELIALGFAGPAAAQPGTLATTYAGGGGQSPVVAFDLRNLTQSPMRVYAFAINSTALPGTSVGGTVCWRDGTAAGNLGSAAGWGPNRPYFGGAAGPGNPSVCRFEGPGISLSLPPGQTVGVAVYQWHAFANLMQIWSQVPPAPPVFANAELSLTAVGASSLLFGGVITDGAAFNGTIFYTFEPVCYANCDNSLIPPFLNVNDFICFNNSYAAQNPYCNCDGSTTPPVLNVNDFMCFTNMFAAGCSVP
jgi:hypothetical protein